MKRRRDEEKDQLDRAIAASRAEEHQRRKHPRHWDARGEERDQLDRAIAASLADHQRKKPASRAEEHQRRKHPRHWDVRDEERDQLDRAIAVSLADHQRKKPSRRWGALDKEESDVERAFTSSLAEDQPRLQKICNAGKNKNSADVNRAIAASLAEAASESQQADAWLSSDCWHCVRCTLVNRAEAGRCAACKADREAPFTTASDGVATLVVAPQRCGLPGCNRERQLHGFCTEDHKRRAERRGLLAPAGPGVERVFIGGSGDYACELLTKASTERASVIAQFIDAWRKPGAVPSVERVYAIRPPLALSERFARYAAAVGNERRRFHGTGAACDFAVDLNRAPCASPACALCSILGRGFLLAHAGSGPNAANLGLRYGPGLYFSATSGKSNDYATHSERLRGGRHWRTMFVATVAAGHAFCTHEGELDVGGPPKGYDSIVGEVGAHLNYDELVVFTEAAALPKFLLVYSAAG